MHAHDDVLDHAHEILGVEEEHRQLLGGLRAVAGDAADGQAGERARGAVAGVHREGVDQLVELEVEQRDQLDDLLFGGRAVLDVLLVVGPEELVHAAEADAGAPALLHDGDVGEPDALQRLVEAVRGLRGHLGTDARDLLELGPALGVGARLGLPLGLLGEVLRPHQHGGQADLHRLEEGDRLLVLQIQRIELF